MMMNPMDSPDFLKVVFDGENGTMEKPLAMAYIQNQTQPDVMDVSDGFSKGTIFKGLDKPFKPWGEK